MIIRFVFTAALALTLAACGTTGAATNSAVTSGASANSVKIGTLTISDPWARASAIDSGAAAPTAASAMVMPTAASGMNGMGGDVMMGASYMTIANSGAADKLIKASTDLAQAAELHTVMNNNGVMEMRPVEGGVEIPANGAVQFKPGGYHVMLIGLTKQLNVGDTVNLKLQFEKAGEVNVVAQVRQ